MAQWVYLLRKLGADEADMTRIEGYGGRAGNHQYAFAHCIVGIGSEDVNKKIAERENDEAEREKLLAMEHD
jgi:hypothetical protein